MDILLKVAKPDIAIFTKLDFIHLEFFKNIEEIWFEKFKLIHSAKKKVYLNYRDSYARAQFEKIKKDKLYFSWKNIEAKNYSLVKDGRNIWAKFKLQNKTIKTNLLWEENSQYIALAFEILDTIAENKKDLPSEIDLSMKLQPWRFNIFAWIKKSILIDSSYNAWPESMKSTIESTIEIRKALFANYKIALVLWDMRELWVHTKKAHKNLAKYVSEASVILTVWKDMKKYFAPEIEKSNKSILIKSFISSKKAWSCLKNILEKDKENYIILFKWSQNTIFTEEALKEVLENKNDSKLLVRQNNFWMNKKHEYFKL